MQENATNTRPAGHSSRWAYWPEVDGLRTIAVLSVAAFHLDRQVLPGGFVGVDIFFVISGFLIGSILIDDIAKREFSIGRFYQRRISRIFPALILVILTTLAVASFVYSAQDMASLGINSAAAAASVINMKLIAQGSYFILSADSQPLLHYWSLAVEEQFYIVFPVYLYLVSRFTRQPLAITACLALLSFGLCVWLTRGHQPLAFYLLPSRAWELLVGSCLASYRTGGGRVASRAAAVSVWCGLALIVGSIALLHEADGFPGWIAIFPVMGTALLLAPIGDARPLPLRLLAHPAMVATGKRSYSLYLWHWPVFSLVDYQFYAADGWLRAGLKIALTLSLTLLSYALVERPARRYLNVRKRRIPLFVATAAAIAAIVAGGVWLRTALYFDVPPSTIASGGTMVRGGAVGTIVLSGDSQAAMYGTEIASIARANGYTLYALGTAGRNQLPDEAGTSWPAVAGLIAAKRPDLVVLIDAWADKLKGDPAVLRKALAEIAGSTRHVLLIAEAPEIPATLSRDSLRHGARPPFFESPVGREKRMASLTMLRGLAAANVTIVDVAPNFVDANHVLRIVGPDGRLTYFDVHHLSDTGTGLTRPLLDRAIRAAIARRERSKPPAIM